MPYLWNEPNGKELAELTFSEAAVRLMMEDGICPSIVGDANLRSAFVAIERCDTATKLEFIEKTEHCIKTLKEKFLD